MKSLFCLPFLFLGFLAIACAPPGSRTSETPLPEEQNRSLGEKSRSSSTKGAKDTVGGHALLVGCTTYDNLPKSKYLKGPANDVALMREVLVKRCHFPEKNIVTLAEGTDADGRPTHADGRPTRANIVREFQRLRETVQPDDQVVILLNGHGSQEPDQAPLDEADGLDEVFCPADVRVWNDKDKRILNAIVDDELGDWSKAIADKGAYVTVIFDSCHSGTMLRGDAGEIAREVPAEELVPRKVLEQARRAGGAIKDSAFALQKLSPRLVGLYAAQAFEPTVELPMPPNGDKPIQRGLLTYTLCQILSNQTSRLTYRELAQRLRYQYASWRRNGPTPFVEGQDIDREVFGVKSWPDRSRFRLIRDEDKGWKVNAGRLLGLTKGSILAVYPVAGGEKADKPLGHVHIAESEIFEAKVEPWEYDKLPKPDAAKLPEGGRCEVVYRDFGELRIPVMIDRLGAKQEQSLSRFENHLRGLLGKPDTLFDLTKDLGKAEWVVQGREDGVWLLSAAAARITNPKKIPADAPQFRLDGDAPTKLQEVLTRVSRAENLRKIAADLSEGKGGVTDVNVQLEMLKLRDKSDTKGEILRGDGREPVLKHGDYVAWRVTNKGREAVDVTLLFIDSNYGIEAAFPRPGTAGDNRVRPGDHLLKKARINSQKSAGLERMVVIAVRAGGGNVDFTCLAQPSLERAKEATRGPAELSLDSPLGKLFQNALYAQGGKRGLDLDVFDKYTMRQVSWRTVAK